MHKQNTNHVLQILYSFSGSICTLIRNLKQFTLDIIYSFKQANLITQMASRYLQSFNKTICLIASALLQ